MDITLSELWESSLGHVQITGGDVLVIYTDGITEVNNADGEEFAESRLRETIRRHLAAPVPSILDAILRATLEFSGGEGKMRRRSYSGGRLRPRVIYS